MLVDYETLVADLVRDDAARLLIAEKDRAIDAAVRRYSEDRPQEKVQDVTPTDANTLPLPGAWEVDFSNLRSLEYPIGQIPPIFIKQERLQWYRTPAALTIKLLDAIAVAANNVRSTYTIKHVVDAANDTIPVQHREPVACWAAASCCDQLASFYAGGTDSTIQADSVQSQSKAVEYSKRAATLRKRYLNELGIDDKRAAPAGAIVELTRPDSWGGPRINHPPLVR